MDVDQLLLCHLLLQMMTESELLLWLFMLIVMISELRAAQMETRLLGSAESGVL